MQLCNISTIIIACFWKASKSKRCNSAMRNKDSSTFMKDSMSPLKSLWLWIKLALEWFLLIRSDFPENLQNPKHWGMFFLGVFFFPPHIAQLNFIPSQTGQIKRNKKCRNWVYTWADVHLMLQLRGNKRYFENNMTLQSDFQLFY